MTGVNRWHARRLAELPAYLFVEIDRLKREAIASGRDVIDFGVGDPDLPTPAFIVDRLVEAGRDPRNHRYSLGTGMPDFRRAAAAFFQRRFGVTLDPDREVLALIGSKEGLGHLPTAVINPGDVVLVPDPGYPVYHGGTVFAGGQYHAMDLTAEHGWLPRFGDIPEGIVRRSRLMFLNYPNNPTGATAPPAFFEEAVAFARKHDLLIAQDAPYSEVFFDEPPSSILQVPGAKDVAVEFHSLSKTFNMTGWRIGFAVGNADALSALAKVKSNLDSGVFQAVQHAAMAALNGAERPEAKAAVDAYRRRRDVLVPALARSGWKVDSPSATFYVWAGYPRGEDSMSVALRCLAEADVVVIPGVGFGAGGEGFVRFALTTDENRTREAVDRLSRLKW